MRYLVLSLLLLYLLPAQADELGRLFFTPQQRAQLDREQERNATPGSNDGSSLTVNGIVQKHGGKRTVWINGVAHEAGSSDERDPASVPITLPGTSKPVKVKVGQKLRIDDIPEPATKSK